MFNYPNPCDTCKEPKCINPSSGCSDWMMRFYVVWKRFNSYQARQYKAMKEKASTVFAYENPDVLMKYLQEGPCQKCKNEPTCDVPCAAYYSWWDARMSVLRKKYNVGEK